jgi:nucleoside-diphosphate-sugar epimerase
MRAADGVEIVVHAASYVGNDPALAWKVNFEGTKNLVEAALAQGVHRIFYVSTAAVYGSGPHHGLSEGAIVPAPTSERSRSRLAAEQIVADAGGVILRPNLVYGRGDKWFIPSLVKIVRLVGGWIDGGDALISAVSVDALGSLVAALTELPEIQRGRVFHAADPEPVRIRAIGELLGSQLYLTLPTATLTRHVGEERLSEEGFTKHQLDMIAEDNWFNSESVWATAGVDVPSGLALSPAALQWYESVLMESNSTDTLRLR